MVSIFLRSLVYNVLFYLLLVFWVIVGIPTFLMPRWAILNVARYWARSSIWLMRVICNTKVEYRGLEKIPKGPLIVASKHQSMWETFALLQFFDQPLFIVKRELMWIPFFGWYLKKSNMIGIDRSAGGRSLLQMARRASDAVRRGRQLVIFPEGTRTPGGAPPHYKASIAPIYVVCCGTVLPLRLASRNVCRRCPLGEGEVPDAAICRRAASTRAGAIAHRENPAPRSTSRWTAHSRDCCRNGRGPAARSGAVRPATAARHIARGRDRPRKPAR